MVVGSLTEATEVAVIGAGPGGYVAAIRLAQLGKEVTVISQDAEPGGVCLLRGCIPSKALIEATKLYSRIQTAEIMGITVEKAGLDIPKLQAWRESIIKKLSQGVAGLFKQHGIKFMLGKATLENDKQLKIQTESGIQQLQFEQAIIATGSRPRPIPKFEYDGKSILSSREALALQEAPKDFLVVGGGYIGLELTGVWARLGSKVTVVEATDSLLPGTDPDLLRPVKKRLKDLGVEVRLQTMATDCEIKKEPLEVTLKGPEGKEQKANFTKVLVAVGRAPNSEDLGLEKAGVTVDAHGFIPINDRCQTNIPNLYAIGDVAGGMMLAHKASREGKVAAANIAGEKDAFDNQVPAIIFTDPEIAYVGLQEKQALDQGLEIETGKFPFAALGRAITMADTEGFVKVVSQKGTGRLLGVQMVGPHVSDLIAEATLALEMGATLEDLALTIHSHPTLPEALGEAVEAVTGMAIHRFQKRR
jgi:dihydrolipoamide dehydrogenase